ncbi:serine hydrolase [Candidatus Sumerlaeota bacterium]|nr:serine hydrolase [Candidatus Sumerlaeota bacterium]
MNCSPFGKNTPGTEWLYSDAGPNWLAECITLAYGRDVNELMFERVFMPLGIGNDDMVWRKNSYRPHEIAGIPRREFGSGISANVDAMARIGYLYLRGGEWNGKQIIPREFVDRVRTTVRDVVGLAERDPELHGNASDHYGLLWWNNADGSLPGVPRDAYWSWGLYDSLIVVIPSLDMVVSRAGKSWKRPVSDDHYAVLRPFLGPLAASEKRTQDASSATKSTVFPGKDWAKASPQSQAVDPAKLRAAVDYLARELKDHGGAGTLFIVRNGCVIWEGLECDRQYQIYSATKSFTSAMLGLLIDDGKVTLSTLARSLDPALAERYPTVTLRHNDIRLRFRRREL